MEEGRLLIFFGKSKTRQGGTEPVEVPGSDQGICGDGVELVG